MTQNSSGKQFSGDDIVGESDEVMASPAAVALPPLDRDALADVVDLVLWAAQLLMKHGAESLRVEETITILGTGLGCDWGDVLVSHNAIIVSYHSGPEFRTKNRRISIGPVNMSLIEEISHLVHRVEEGVYDRFQVRAELQRISDTPRHYSRWVTVLAVGLACGAFSRNFGGGWPIFGVTCLAASLAMVVRQELTHRNFNSLLVVVATAFSASAVVGAMHLLPPFSQDVGVGLAASVLLLVPGVPFINALEDMLKGYNVVGLARFTAAMLVILGIALGLIMGMQIIGVNKL